MAEQTKLRVLIADDEPLARERLRDLLASEVGVEIVAECSNGASAVQAICEHAPDLVFLDVRMPELDGFEVVHALGDKQLPSIVFVSAYEEHVIKAFDAGAIDYLLKPFDVDRFKKAMRRGRNSVSRQQSQQVAQNIRDLLSDLNTRPRVVERLAVRSTGKVTLISCDEIDWIRGADNYVELHSGKNIHYLRETLSTLEGRLPPDQFIRISRSLLVRLDRIAELQTKAHGDSLLILRDGTQLPASRKYRKQWEEKLGL